MYTLEVELPLLSPDIVRTLFILHTHTCASQCVLYVLYVCMYACMYACVYVRQQPCIRVFCK